MILNSRWGSGQVRQRRRVIKKKKAALFGCRQLGFVFFRAYSQRLLKKILYDYPIEGEEAVMFVYIFPGLIGWGLLLGIHIPPCTLILRASPSYGTIMFLWLDAALGREIQVHETGTILQSCKWPPGRSRVCGSGKTILPLNLTQWISPFYHFIWSGRKGTWNYVGKNVLLLLLEKKWCMW